MFFQAIETIFRKLQHIKAGMCQGFDTLKSSMYVQHRKDNGTHCPPLTNQKAHTIYFPPEYFFYLSGHRNNAGCQLGDFKETWRMTQGFHVNWRLLKLFL